MTSTLQKNTLRTFDMKHSIPPISISSLVLQQQQVPSSPRRVVFKEESLYGRIVREEQKQPALQSGELVIRNVNGIDYSLSVPIKTLNENIVLKASSIVYDKLSNHQISSNSNNNTSTSHVEYKCSAIEGDLKVKLTWKTSDLKSDQDSTFLVVCQIGEKEELYKIVKWIQLIKETTSATDEEEYIYSTKFSLPVYSTTRSNNRMEVSKSPMQIASVSNNQKPVEFKVIPAYSTMNKWENFEIKVYSGMVAFALTVILTQYYDRIKY
jgi:hypothetical protein